MHNEMLQVEGKKMSKSLGNFFTVRDLLDQGFAGEVIRMVYLGTHYTRPMDWTAEKAAQAEGALRRWRGLTAGVAAAEPAPAVLEALADDLNTAGAIAALHALERSGDLTGLKASAALLGLLEDGMGAWAAVGDDVAALIEALLADRAAARQARDFARADALRDGFVAAGVLVKDTAGGTEWELAPGFDRARLEALR